MEAGITLFFKTPDLEVSGEGKRTTMPLYEGCVLGFNVTLVSIRPLQL